MEPANSKSHPAHPASVRSIFLRPRDAAARTRLDRQPVPPPKVTKPRRARCLDQPDYLRISKTRESNDHLDPSSILADKFAGSLDQYRENVESESKHKLDEVERNLVGGLEELTVDVETRFRTLAEIEEHLQRPFVAEALTKIPLATDTDQAPNDEVLLKDRISKFRALREEKEDVLCILWNEWEDIQFDLLGLAVEALGKQSIQVAQLQNGALKPGQRERLEKTIDSAQKIHDGVYHRHTALGQDLTGFEETMGQISNRTKKAATDMQQQYNVQKNKLFKGLMQSIEELAAL
ncbi:uncharacterized protein Z519_08329 [Cladophialophora bantiana CBS 173.52]|uniref:Uncharacterized protein n=1 Tax=Cladophialophora bantiana (strain ATCC 10958 / CBS 173.52 / CDC B-1940 / NIH 8579) TaxID=1442370 RepID=A0A0D2HDR3_CLAB1|nr:uncharacterized protein Z519_08329 [Cladophialophora bantiana CBS 173.52]KIW91433.1 hypothetical protein Z519_08329 [Cladophialophora bantiana CBS 173.52]